MTNKEIAIATRLNDEDYNKVVHLLRKYFIRGLSYVNNGVVDLFEMHCGIKSPYYKIFIEIRNRKIVKVFLLYEGIKLLYEMDVEKFIGKITTDKKFERYLALLNLKAKINYII